MIEKYYATHIKTRLDAAAINVMRSQESKEEKEPTRKPRLHHSLQTTERECKFRKAAL
jgi:hypothetical protein